MIDQREALRRLIDERREDFAGLSRLLGRNSAYVQQFIKRGSPRRLSDRDVATLARYFGVAPESLGGGADMSAGDSSLVRIPILDVDASAGAGAHNDLDRVQGQLGFERTWLRKVVGGPADKLSCIRVQGDSMEPTLSDGDDILVNEADGTERLRDGIYVLRAEGTLLAKRLAINPADRSITIKSDNPSYPDWNGCDVQQLAIIGRVVWAGRRIG